MDRDDANTNSPMLGQNHGRKTIQFCAAISVSLGAFCAGTCLAWTSPALAQLQPSNTTTSDTIILSPQEEAAIGGMIAIGALISAIPSAFLADKIGRKAIVVAISLSFLLNWLLIYFAQNAATIIAGRVFAGIGTGAICVTGPMYIGEIAEARLRGTLGAFINMFLCLGILTTCIIGTFTTWRTLSIILIIMPILLGTSFVFMPESPVFLVRSRKLSAAEKSLLAFRGSQYDIHAELKTIQRAIEESSRRKAHFFDIFTKKANRKALFSGVAVLAFQQLCGVNAVVFYTVPIFKAAGSSLSPDLIGILIALVQVLAAYLSLIVIEKANRKFYLMLSSLGMMLFLTSLGMFFHLQKLQVDVTSLGFIPVTSAVLFMVFFSSGYGPIPWMLMGELFAPEVKAIGNGFAIATNWTCAFLVTFFFPIISNGVGAYLAFYISAGIMAFATIYVYFVVPETRGRSLLEIQHILGN